MDVLRPVARSSGARCARRANKEVLPSSYQVRRSRQAGGRGRCGGGPDRGAGARPMDVHKLQAVGEGRRGRCQVHQLHEGEGGADDQAGEGQRGDGVDQGGPQEAVSGTDPVRTPEDVARVPAHPFQIERPHLR